MTFKKMRRTAGVLMLSSILALLIACAGEAETIVVEKEIIKEVPVEKIVEVEKEVVKTIEVPGETKIVEKEVVKTVEVAGETVVVEKEVVKEVIKEVPVEVIVEMEVVKVVEMEVEKPQSYNEAPGRAQAVSAGNLPPVGERLPSEPMVMPVFGSIGKYGGTLRRGYLGPQDGCNMFRVSRTSLVRFAADGFNLIPSVAKSLTPNSDGTVWTAKLRKGMKWSDGSPFTADDLIFQYEDVIMNDELTPSKPAFLKLGDGLGTVAKIDETTVEFRFPGQHFLFAEIAAQADEACYGNTRNVPWAPAHYMKQFLPKYNSDVAALAEAGGFEDWTQLYLSKTQYNLNIEKPTLAPWKFTSPLGGQIVSAERNPYFMGVDAEGNQLPYLDKVSLILVADKEVLQVKALAGEIDLQGRHISLEDYPTLKAGEESGGYVMAIWGSVEEIDAGFAVNASLEGPLGDIFKQADFRHGLSHALNRDEINEVSFLGLGTPRNQVPAQKSHPFYPGDEYANLYMEYDPDKANAYLDSVGLDTIGDDGYRLLPNGDPFQIVITATCAFGAWCDIAEQGAEMWKAVGVNAKADIVTRALLQTRRDANESHVSVWDQISAGFIFSAPQHLLPTSNGFQPGPAYGTWEMTGGVEGIEPPQEYKELMDLYKQGPLVADAERAEIGKEIYRRLAEAQYTIGVAGLSPMIQGVIVKNKDLRNVPDAAANSWPHRTPNTGFPEQWYYDR